MATWIALLRAVNVGARTYPMAQLRAALDAAGYEDVQTHIQTGNVLLTSPLRSRAKLEAQLERVLASDVGFAVVTICLTPKEIRDVAKDAAELSSTHEPTFGHYVSILKDSPTATVVEALEGLSREGERVIVRGRAVHLLYDVEYHKAKTANATLEKKAGAATNRNARVIAALAQKWGAS